MWNRIWKVHSSALWLAIVRIAVGYIFLTSGIEKLANPGLAASMPGTLTRFASENPHLWYKGFLLNTAIPHAALFGQLTAWGETLAGVSLVLGAITPLGAIGALFLNLNIYFASGWTSPSTDSLSVLMIVVDLVILLGMAGRVLSVDQLLAHWLPKIAFWSTKETVCAPAPEARMSHA